MLFLKYIISFPALVLLVSIDASITDSSLGVEEQYPETRRSRLNDLHTSPKSFHDICIQYHRQNSITGDNFIDNVEAAGFFPYLCQRIGNPHCLNSISFDSLSIEIQLAFVNFICPPDQISYGMEYDACLTHERTKLDNYGYISYEITTNKDLDEDLENYCANLYPLSDEYHFGTFQPSTVPSTSPSASPSSSEVKNKNGGDYIPIPPLPPIATINSTPLGGWAIAAFSLGGLLVLSCMVTSFVFGCKRGNEHQSHEHDKISESDSLGSMSDLCEYNVVSKQEKTQGIKNNVM